MYQIGFAILLNYGTHDCHEHRKLFFISIYPKVKNRIVVQIFYLSNM